MQLVYPCGHILTHWQHPATIIFYAKIDYAIAT